MLTHHVNGDGVDFMETMDEALDADFAKVPICFVL